MWAPGTTSSSDNLQDQTDSHSDWPRCTRSYSHYPSILTPSRNNARASSLLIAVARLGDEDSSKQRLPCKTSAKIVIRLQINGLRQTAGTHSSDLLKVIVRAHPQHFDRNVVILILAFPDISIPARIQWVIRSVVGNLDSDGSWEQAQTTTYLAQSTQAYLLEPWR